MGKTRKADVEVRLVGAEGDGFGFSVFRVRRLRVRLRRGVFFEGRKRDFHACRNRFRFRFDLFRREGDLLFS